MSYSTEEQLPTTLRNQLLHCFAEHPSMVVHIFFRGSRSHERHVVKGRQQNAPIHGVKVHEVFQIKVHCRTRFRPILGMSWCKQILRATSQTSHMPGNIEFGDSLLDPSRPALSQWNHVIECLLGEH